MRELVENGLLTIPLYHGTSSLFVESIRSYGLGARNPIKEYGVLRFLEIISLVCDDLLPNDEEWAARRIVVGPMIKQEVLGGRANFQHGDSYLTPSRSSAVGYALSNPFGSELISQAFFLFRMLETRRPGELERRAISHDLLKLFSQRPSPVLVTATNVPITSVAGEAGNPADEVVQQLREMFDWLNMPGITLNVNFRLVRPLPTNCFMMEPINELNESNPYAD